MTELLVPAREEQAASTGSPLRVSLVSALLDRQHGGPASVLRAHASALSSLAQVRVFAGSASRNPDPREHELPGHVRLHLFPYATPHRWFYCEGMSSALSDPSVPMDLLHAHMVWDHPVHVASRVSRRRRLPLVVTPHGSLNLDGRNRGAAKAAYGRLVLQPLLKEAAALHVLTSAEAQACEAQGLRCPIHVIPNGLPRERFETRPDPSLAWQRWPLLRGRRVLLYLGRLWSGKGLDILPPAWARVVQRDRHDEWLLVLAGPDYRGYRRVLEQQVQALRLQKQVLITGELDAPMRDAMLAASSAFVLPSHGEGFSMAVLEAMAARLPLLITEACNFPDVATSGAGFVVPTRIRALHEGLATIVALSDRARREMGERGWRLARERYVMESVAEQLMRMYRSCL